MVSRSLHPSRGREGVNGPTHEHGEDQQREQGLHHHQNLRPPAQDSGVGGAEGGARVEGEEEVVQKAGDQARAVLSSKFIWGNRTIVSLSSSFCRSTLV